MNKTTVQLYGRAIEKWGEEAQVIKAIEELAELSVLLAKKVNGFDVKDSDLFGELADAEIMIEQLKVMFGEKTAAHFYQYKLAALHKRLK